MANGVERFTPGFSKFELGIFHRVHSTTSFLSIFKLNFFVELLLNRSDLTTNKNALWNTEYILIIFIYILNDDISLHAAFFLLRALQPGLTARTLVLFCSIIKHVLYCLNSYFLRYQMKNEIT